MVALAAARLHPIYVPEGFDPDHYPGTIAKHPDAARWFLNCVYFKSLIRNYGEDDFVSLHSHLLGLVLGKKDLVKPVREALVAYRLIDCDRRYVVDHKSFGYRIGTKLQGVPWTQYRSQNKRFLKRIERFKDWVRQPQGFSVPVHQHLAFWVRRVELPDTLPAIDFRAAEPGRVSKREVAMHQVEMIRQQLVHVSVCNYGRFHSNFTGLCREIRQNLLIDSEPLVEVDIVNSQPYFLSLLLLEIHLTSRNMPDFSSFLLKRGRERALPYDSRASAHFYDDLVNFAALRPPV